MSPLKYGRNRQIAPRLSLFLFVPLAEAKDRLEEAQALARIGSWSYDILTNTHHWSKQIYSIFGFEDSNAQPNYQKMLQTFEPDDAAKLDTAVKTAVIDGTPYSLVVRVRKPHSQSS